MSTWAVSQLSREPTSRTRSKKSRDCSESQSILRSKVSQPQRMFTSHRGSVSRPRSSTKTAWRPTPLRSYASTSPCKSLPKSQHRPILTCSSFSAKSSLKIKKSVTVVSHATTRWWLEKTSVLLTDTQRTWSTGRSNRLVPMQRKSRSEQTCSISTLNGMSLCVSHHYRSLDLCFSVRMSITRSRKSCSIHLVPTYERKSSRWKQWKMKSIELECH